MHAQIHQAYRNACLVNFAAVCIAIPRIAMAVRMLKSTIIEEMEKDYVRNAGCAVEIHLYKAQDGEKDFEGILKAWDADTVTIAIDEAEEITFRKTDIALIRQAIEF